MRHIVYSLAAFALANGASTSPSTVNSNSPMAPAASSQQSQSQSSPQAQQSQSQGGSTVSPSSGGSSGSSGFFGSSGSSATTSAPAGTTAPGSNNNQNGNANGNGKAVGNLNGGSISDWNSIWTGGWSGTLSNYLNPALHLSAPLNVYAPTTLSTWNMAVPSNTFGPNWGSGQLAYPNLAPQSWFSNGQRFSWSFMPLTAASGFQFTSDMKTCVLKQIENEVHTNNNNINNGWLNPVSGSNTTQLATDVNSGTAQSGAYWLSWIIPFGAPNNPVSTQGFVSPFLGILRSPQFYSDLENNCHIPASNFTVLNNAVQWKNNAWGAPSS